MILQLKETLLETLNQIQLFFFFFYTSEIKRSEHLSSEAWGRCNTPKLAFLIRISLHYSSSDSASFVKINTVDMSQEPKAYREHQWFQIPAPTPFSLSSPMLWLILFLRIKQSASLLCIKVSLENLVENSLSPPRHYLCQLFLQLLDFGLLLCVDLQLNRKKRGEGEGTRTGKASGKTKQRKFSRLMIPYLF